MLSSRFKVLCADAGLSLEEAAKLLHVTPRTIRYWFSGKVSVPYAAYKLVRVLRWFELPGAAWAGWHFHGGKLWTPEGYAFEPQDSNWWSLLVRQARGFQTVYERNNVLLHELRVRGQVAPVGAGDAPASPEPVGAIGPGAGTPVPARREAPGSNLLIEHFSNQGARDLQKHPSVIGELAKQQAVRYKGKVSHGGKQGARA